MVTTTDTNEVISRILALRPDLELLSRCSGADSDYTVKVMNPVSHEMVAIGVSGIDYDAVAARASGVYGEIKAAVSGWSWGY